MHGQDSNRLEVRDDGTPALLAGIALYFQFVDVGASDDGATKHLLAHRLESEGEAMDSGREGFEGLCRPKPSIDWSRNHYRCVKKWSRWDKKDDKMWRALNIGEQSIACVAECVLSRRWGK